MNKKNKFLKTLLATTSALAILTGATNAMAADVTTTATHFMLKDTTNNGTNINNAGAAGAAVFNTGDNLIYGADGHVGTAGSGMNNHTIAVIETEAWIPGVFKVQGDNAADPITLTVASVTTTAPNATLPIQIDLGSKLVLSGGAAYAGLASIDGVGDGQGTLQLTGNGLVYAGTIGNGGASALAAIEFNAGDANAISLTGAAIKATNLKYIDASKVTIGGDVYGNIDFDGKDGELIIVHEKQVSGDIDNKNVMNAIYEHKGNVTFSQNATVTGDLGATKGLNIVKFGDGAGGVVNIGGTAKAIKFIIGHNNTDATVTGRMTGNVEFGAEGQLTANGGITGDVNFTDKAGTLILGAGGTINGTVDGTVAAGNLVFAGGGTANKAIGSAGGLASVTFNTGNVNLVSTAKATEFKINDNAAVVNATGLMTGLVKFYARGSLIANGGIDGAVNFNGQDGTLTLADGQTITGIINNAAGGGGGHGHLVFAGAGTANAAIGGGGAAGANKLTSVTFYGAGAVTLGGTANATTFTIANAGAEVTADGLLTGNVTFGAAGKLTAANGIAGDVEFGANGGTINVAAGQNINGAVTATGAGPDGKGTLVFEGAGAVTGDIGAAAAAGAGNPSNALKLIQAGNGAVKFNGDVYAKTLQLSHANAQFTLAADKTITGAIITLGNGATGGKLVFEGGGTVDGDIGTNDHALDLIQAAAGAHEVKLGGGQVYAAKLQLAANANSQFTIADNKTIHGAVTTLGNGAGGNGGKLVFEGAGGVTGDIGAALNGLNLVQAAGVGEVTLGGDVYATTLNLANAGAIFTLGDNKKITGAVTAAAGGQGHLKFEGKGEVTGAIGGGNNLASVTFNGAGAVTLRAAANATTFTIAHENAEVTANGLLTGNVTFSAAGQLTAIEGIDGAVEFGANGGTINVAAGKNINGAVTATGAGLDGKGTLVFAGNGEVTGAIGADANRVELIQAGNGAVKFNEDVYAKTLQLSHSNAQFTLVDNKTITGAIITLGNGATGGKLVFEGAGEVVGNIGTNDHALDLIKLAGAGSEVKLGGGQVHAAQLELAAHVNSKFTIADGTTINGAVTTLGDNVNGGKLVFARGGGVTGDIGSAGGGAGDHRLLLVEAGGDGEVKLGGNVYATTLNLANAGAIFTLGDNKKITGAVTAAVNEEGHLKFEGKGEVTGAIGGNVNALASITAGDGDVKFNEHVYANILHLGHANSQFILVDNKKITGAITDNGNGDTGGKLVFEGTGEVTGTIGADANRVKLIQAADAAVKFGGNVYATELKLANNANSQFTIADTVKITGNITTLGHGGIGGGADGGKLVFEGAGEVEGNIGTNGHALNLIHANGAGAVTLKGDVYATTLHLFDHNSEFTLADQKKITGNITTASPGHGKLNFVKSGTVDGNIGEVHKLAEINIKAANAKVTLLGQHVNANAINIGDAGTGAATLIRGGNVNFEIGEAGISAVTFGHEDSVLQLQNTNAADHIVTLKGNIVKVGGGGIVKLLSESAGQKLTIQDAAAAGGAGPGGQTLGDAGTLLNQVLIAGGGIVDIDVPVSVQNGILFEAASTLIAKKAISGSINFDDKDGIVELHNRISTNVDSSTDNHGTLIFAADGSTVTGTIGATRPLKEVKFNAGNNAVIMGGAARAKKFTYVDNDEVTAGGTTTGNIDFAGNAGTFKAGDSITGKVDSTRASNGTLVFTAVGGVTGTIGATNPLAEVKFNAGGGAVIMGGAARAADFTYVNADTVTAVSTITGDIDFASNAGTFQAGGLITGNVNSTAGSAGMLTFTADGGVTGNVGATNPLAQINVTAKDSTVHLQGTHAKATAINIGNAGTGAATLIRGGNVNFEIGEAGISAVTFGHEDSKLQLQNTGGYSKIVTLKGNLGVAADDQAIIALHATNRGKLTINNVVGESIGTDNAHRIKELVISGGGQIEVEVPTFAKELRFASPTSLKFTGIGLDQGEAGKIDLNGHNVTLEGDIKGKDTTIDLGSNKLTYKKGSATLKGHVTINANVGGVNSNGQIVLEDKDSKLDMSNADGITINLNGDASIVGAGTTYYIIHSKNANLQTPSAQRMIVDPTGLNHYDPNKPLVLGGGTYNSLSVVNGNRKPDPTPTPSSDSSSNSNSNSNSSSGDSKIMDQKTAEEKATKFNDNNRNAYVAWKPHQETKTGYAVEKLDLKAAGLQKDLGETHPEVVSVLSSIDTSVATDATDFLDTVGVMSTVDRVRQKEAVDRMEVITTTSEAIETAMTTVFSHTQNTLSTRINSVTTPAINVPSVGAAPAANMGGVNSLKVSQGATARGVAAGGEAERYGFWGSPVYSASVQKKKESVAGYKGSAFGGTFGFDALLNDQLTIGAAATMMGTTLDHQDQKKGDSTKITTTMFSVYAAHNLTDSLFAQGIISYGVNKVTNKEKRIINATTEQTATGKYDSTSYGGEAMIGYRIAMSEQSMYFTPMVGLRYASFSDDSYTETGTNRRNMKVDEKSGNKLEGIFGARTSFALPYNELFAVTELHGFVNQELQGQNAKTKATLNGLPAPMPTKDPKEAKTSTNLGASINLSHNSMEYGIGYDAYIAKEYVSHQGSLKVRVNF